MAVGTALVAVTFIPYSEPLPAYLHGAQELLATGHISDHHSPGYMLFLALALKTFGAAGILLFQAGLFVVLCAIAFAVLRQLHLAPVLCWLGTLPVMLHPTLVVNITRISDNNLTVVLLLCLVSMLLRIKKSGFGWSTTLAGGLVCVAMLLVRPNMISLLPVGMFITWHDHRALWTTVVRWTVILVVGVLGALVVNHASKGVWQVSDPYYVAYTLHNGTNPRSAETLLRETTGEYSTFEALEDEGILDLQAFSKDQQTELLLSLSWRFVRDNPFAYGALLGTKILNFFRPDYRRINSGGFGPSLVIGCIQTLLATPALIWMVLRLRTRRHIRWDAGLYGVLLLPMYLLPFVLTYSEPRYRWPIDVLLLLEAAYLVSQTAAASFGARPAPQYSLDQV